jgi:RES domain-containing protein
VIPSYVAWVERNIVLNPAHPEFPQVATSLHEPVWWDERLW